MGIATTERRSASRHGELSAAPLGYVDGMSLFEYVGSNPQNATDPTGLTRFIFIFEGLLGYGPDGWKHWKERKDHEDPFDKSEGGRLLRLLLRAGINPTNSFAGGGSTGTDGVLNMEDPKVLCGTVVSYYKHDDVEKALTFANSVRLSQTYDCDGKKNRHTVIVIGHSFGGDAAWEFAKRLKQQGVTVDAGLTLDPRPRKGFLGEGEEKGTWNGDTQPPALSWWNGYRPEGDLKGYPLPGARSHTFKSGFDHNDIVNKADDTLKSLVDLLRKVPIGTGL